MPRYGSPAYFRQKHISLVMFTGFVLIAFYSYTLSNRGRLIADTSLIVGAAALVIGLALLVRERAKETAQGG